MNTRGLLMAAIASFAGLASLSAARADQITADFTVENGTTNVPSGAQVTFTLDSNGQISAVLTSTLAGSFFGFAFNSAAINLPESNFSVAVDNAEGWIDSYGYQPSGFLCTKCGTTETWTIGTAGEFTSVFQALNGGSQSQYDFFLLDDNGNAWAANPGRVPEPMTLSLFGVGLAGAAALRRRRKASVAV